MKVGLMVYGDLEQLSGGYLYDRMLVRELRRRGHHVNVFPLHRDPCTERDEHADRKVRSWMNEQDIVVQDELCHPSLLGLNASRERSVVALVHNLSACLASSNETVHAMERSFLKGVDAVICTSHATLAACRSLHPLLPPATVAYPGRDHVLPRPRLPGGSDLRILHVGNIHPVKGLDVLLAALSELMPFPFRLDVVGSIVDEDFFRSLGGLMRGPMRDRVRFLGPVPMADMWERYCQADVMATPSRYEGFGIALLEAMGFGVPVIAGQEGGARELVANGREGFLVPPGDHAAVARYLQALSDDDLREEMGRAARRRWEAHPTWERSLAGAVDMIEGVQAACRG
ncbi:MAG: glycosyltransferase family 4 protein [Methanomassiliicoccaceae archaeon]|jgi:glycosyltransferase involved in cell wall biosynthesis|nr:glycosyltransferase family 4 protein [Euryarchaeota archaeon]HOB37743.1 glycosyltransferase family 4 protein [Methanomassiliicoccaceae archaeon]HOL06908.1 glycosyltransferase family 4 protein [Methanomassiliicoccaceae archaeon]HOQ25409.1 glycosyltransferase family 4 protein [Methanomassiliicoccaceae archaeon]HQA20656.1 glycosyltransferase family 4 protein [Methanomassiliicoccaceae archaeon]